MPAAYHRERRISEAPASGIDYREGGSLLSVLAYFDLFDYPLKKEEIIQYLDRKVNESNFDLVIKVLLEEKIIFQFQDYYSLRNNVFLVPRRIEGNHLAEGRIPPAIRAGRFLLKFPGVRAVAISGSLSKLYAEPQSDVDYFIITSANRLWLTRTFMHLFKKLTYLFGRQHDYCMNYYLDESALPINQQNIFTAIEIKTLLPVARTEALERFFESNRWTDELLPNHADPIDGNISTSQSRLKTVLEWAFNGKIGEGLDNYLFQFTRKRWDKKMKKRKCNVKGQVMGMVTGKHFAWSDPESFQEKVIQQHQKKLDALKMKHPHYFEFINSSFAG